MRCPIYKNEMETGYLQGRQRIAWVKRKHKVSLLPQNGEILDENHAYSDFFFCRAYLQGL